jgi:hypothetical protein
MGDLRLVVDYGGAVVRAGLSSNGVLTPLKFDGAWWLPSAVYVAETGEVITGHHAVSRGLNNPPAYVPNTIRHLGQPSLTVGSLTVDPVDLVGAVLRHVASVAVADAGTSLDGLTVVVPAGWGPRRRAPVYRAAAAAGLPTPVLVLAPVAVLATVGAPAVPGAAVVVCDIGETFTATVLESASDGWQVLSAVDAADGGGAAADEALMAFVCQRIATEDAALATRLTQPADDAQVRDRMLMLAQVRAAKEAAAFGPVLMPTSLPQLSIALDPGRLAELTVNVRARAVAAVTAAVEAADLETGQLVGVCGVGASARLPGLVEACAGSARAPLLPVSQPEFAAVTGAASIQPPAAPARTGGSGWSALAAVSTALAVVLAPMLLYTAMVSVPDERLNAFGMSLHFNYGMYGLACGLAGTAALGGAVLAVTALPASRISGVLGLPASLPLRRLPGLIVAGSAVFAAVLVWMYQVVTTAFVEPDPPGLSRWTVLPILPTCLAGVILGCAIIARADDASLDRLRRLAFPVLPLAFAAIGALAYEHTRHIELAYKMHWVLYLALRCSAGLIAAGAVVLLLAGLRPLVIAIVTVPVAVLAAAVVNVDGLGVVAASYLGAAAWWWLSRAVSTSAAVLRRPVSATGFAGQPPGSFVPVEQPRSPAPLGGQGSVHPHNG